MELWIRSQDKDVLQKITSLFVNDDGYIFSYDYINSNEVFLGKYNSKERALEVLDEIQNLIKPILLFQNCECDNDTLKAIKKIGACMVNNDARIEQINQTVFYEMPKE